MAQTTTIGGRSVRRGERTVLSFPVTRDLDGNDIALIVHAVVGAHDGPVLALLSALHGVEWQSVEVVRRVLSRVKPDEMHGTLLAVPVGNPVAFGHLTRNTPDESDAPDLNRVFPGDGSWIAEQLAASIAHNVLNAADALIDLHLGTWAVSMAATAMAVDYPDEDVVRGSRALVEAFGHPCVHEFTTMTGFPGPRSSLGYFGGVLNKPAMAVEIGGAGFGPALEEEWLDTNVAGTLNVLRHLGILPGEPPSRDRFLFFRKRWRVNPVRGGYLIPTVPPTRLLTQVENAEELGVVLSPYTFEELEKLKSPGQGILFYTAREYPVRPGDWAFGVIDHDDPYTRWETPSTATAGR